MIKRLSRLNRIPIRDMLRRIDRVVADLNVLLVIVAIGLATLDVTFLITQKVVDHLPPVTRIRYVSSGDPGVGPTPSTIRATIDLAGGTPPGETLT